MSTLFEATAINKMKLANRFVRSATWEGMAADDGSVTPQLTKTMMDLAEGGVGLIISGHAYVSPEGQAGPWQLGIYKDDLIDGLKSMCDAVHAAGGKIVAQLAHAGHFAIGSITRQPPHVVSNFDGLSKSPRHELTREDSVAAAKMLAEAGLDAIELSGGTLSSGKLSPSRAGITKEEKEAYFKDAAAIYKKELDIPLILVGGMRSLNVAEQTINSGTADYISMCRPFIREPALVKRWQSGDTRPAKCKSDNLCFGPALEGKGIYCVTEALETK